MEARINKKIHDYMSNVKKELKEMVQAKCSIPSEQHSLMNYIEELKDLELSSLDFSKRKRVRNTVPIYERCQAKRADGHRCTRKKKQGKEYCGTHIKSQPHGIIEMDEEKKECKKVMVRTQDINGVIYYIDDFNNVYYHQDIMNNVHNPRVFAKYEYDKDTSTYHIVNSC